MFNLLVAFFIAAGFAGFGVYTLLQYWLLIPAGPLGRMWRVFMLLVAITFTGMMSSIAFTIALRIYAWICCAY